jgi:hypothetical protein
LPTRANSAHKSFKVLGEVLQLAGGNLEEVPGSRRLPDVHALNKLDSNANNFLRWVEALKGSEVGRIGWLGGNSGEQAVLLGS